MRLTRAQLLLPLVICLLCQAMYRAFSVSALAYTAREAFFGGLCAAVVGALLVLVFLRLGGVLSVLPTESICKNVVCALLCLCLLFVAGQTVIWQLRFYQQMFGTGGWWVLLLCVAAAFLHCTPHALGRCARLLLAFCVVGAFCALLGLLGQSDLQRLAAEPLSTAGFSAAFWAQLCLLPDYLLLLACPVSTSTANKHENSLKEKQNDSDFRANKAKLAKNKVGRNENTTAANEDTAKFFLLPLLTFGVQFAAVLFTELLFGVQQAGVGGFEFLRSWALLNLSRYDGIVALLWLLLAFFRLRVFVFVAAQCNPFARAAKQSITGEGAVG